MPSTATASRRSTKAWRAQLVAARDTDARQLARLDKDRNQVQAAADQLVGLEQQVKGKIATIVEQSAPSSWLPSAAPRQLDWLP